MTADVVEAARRYCASVVAVGSIDRLPDLTQEQADMVRATERAAFRNLADAVCNEMERRWSA